MIFSGLRRAFCLCVLAALAISLAGAQHTLWAKRLEYMGNQDEASCLTIDPSGSVFVAGLTYNGNTHDILIVKYGAAGQRLWIRKLGGPDHRESVRSIATDSGGNLLLAGYFAIEGGYQDIFIIKLDPQGQLLWRRNYADPSGFGDFAQSLKVDAVGNVYVAATLASTTGASDIGLLKYATDGKFLWIRRYGTPWMRDVASRLVVDAYGNSYVAGMTAGNGTDWDLVALKFAPDGRQIWLRRMDGPFGFNDYLDDIALDSAGNLVIAATTDKTWNSSDYQSDLWLMKYSPAGGLLWSRIYGFSNERRDAFAKVAIDSNNNISVAAHSQDFFGADYLVLRYGPDGGFQWGRSYDSVYGYHDIPYGIVVDSAGSIYVTGYSWKRIDQDKDYATVKYGPDGSRKWVRRYDSPSQLDDVALGIALAPDGNVVVTGYSRLASIDVAPDIDFYTIKYKSGN